MWEVICRAIRLFGTEGREEARRQNEEEKDTRTKECHKDVIRSNERKSKMPVSVKEEWVGKRNGVGRERRGDGGKKREEEELGRGNARMS